MWQSEFVFVLVYRNHVTLIVNTVYNKDFYTRIFQFAN